ncbi:MAG: HEPN domain-containing protein [Planctomycetes bacterium]|nr:HEPN domain-containing protein [Planctomycetota bacterium]
MSSVAREFVTKAKADWVTARREAAATQDYNPDAVCFHAQQCVEKLMKALLIFHGQKAPKTHDLFELDRLLVLADASWKSDPLDLQVLVPAAVDYRYPGVSATKIEAELAFAAAERVRRVAGPFLVKFGESI